MAGPGGGHFAGAVVCDKLFALLDKVESGYEVIFR